MDTYKRYFERLDLAVESGDVAAVAGLVQEAGDVEIRDAEGSTPLMYAVRLDQPEIVEMLLSAGANVHSVAFQGQSVLAFCTGREPRVLELLLGAGLNTTGRDAEELLLFAGTEVVRILLTSGVNPDARSEFDHSTRLMGSAGAGDVDSIRLLLQAGADIDAQDKYGETALMWGAGAGQAPVVRELLAAGADVNILNDHGEPALRWALTSGSVEVARLLLEAGSVIPPGALHIPVDSKRAAMVELLLEHGASPRDRDGEGLTAWERAIKPRRPAVKILRMLRAALERSQNT